MKRAVAPGLVTLLLAAGCATTERVAVQESPAICSFLGQDACAELKPGAKGEAGLRYVNPRGQFTKYNKVIVNVVGFYGGDTARVSPKEQEALTALFQKTLTEALAKRYQVVDQPGPDVMKVQAAIMDAEAATPGARSVSMVIPQLRLLGLGYYAVAGKYPFVGGGQAAVKITDSATGQVLGAAADRRVGGGSIETAAQWQWGDAENVIKQWSEMISNAMYSYTSGAKKP